MISKFETHSYWKHKRCMDVFLFVNKVLKHDSTRTVLSGMWLTQGSITYWPASPMETVIITAKEHSSWESYLPRGKMWMHGAVPEQKVYEV